MFRHPRDWPRPESHQMRTKSAAAPSPRHATAATSSMYHLSALFTCPSFLGQRIRHPDTKCCAQEAGTHV